MTSTPTLNMDVLPTQVVVTSATDPGTTYLVQLPYCPCKDFRYRRTRKDLAPAERFCKHILTAIERAAHWHRAERPKSVYSNLFHDDIKQLLTDGQIVGFTGGEANALLRNMTDSGAAFSVASGAPVDGKVEYEKLPSRYTLTVYGTPA
jgi:hypothetical protein